MSRRVQLPADFRLAPGGRRLLDIEGHSIALFNIDGVLYAIGDDCPHHGASLCHGRLEGRMIQCPAHAMCFDLATGAMPFGGLRLATYPVACRDGVIEISLPDALTPDTGRH